MNTTEQDTNCESSEYVYGFEHASSDDMPAWFSSEQEAKQFAAYCWDNHNAEPVRKRAEDVDPRWIFPSANHTT